MNSYSPFRKLIVEQEEVKLNIGFNSKYEYASGLIYYNNHYYDSELGRFISQDPIFEEGGVKLYNFVENDPINHWDILGNISINYGTLTLIGDASFSDLNYTHTTFSYNDDPTFFEALLLYAVDVSVNFTVDITGTVGVSCSTTYEGEFLTSSANFTGTVDNYSLAIGTSVSLLTSSVPYLGQLLTAYKVEKIIDLGLGAASGVASYIRNVPLIITGASIFIAGAHTICASNLQMQIDALMPSPSDGTIDNNQMLVLSL